MRDALDIISGYMVQLMCGYFTQCVRARGDFTLEGDCVVIKTLLLSMTVLSIPLAASAAWIDLGGAPGSRVEAIVLEDGPAGTVIEFSLPGFYLREASLEGRAVSVVRLPGAVTFLEEGLPELPRVTKSIIVPDDAHMSSTVTEASYISFDVPRVIPSRGNLLRTVDPQDVPFTFSDFYSTDSWFPEETLLLHEPFILRDFRGISCQFNPFQYNPASGTLRVCQKLVVNVHPDGAGADGTGADGTFTDGTGVTNVKKRRTGGVSAAFHRIYRSMFLNNGTSGDEGDLWVTETGRMLIVVDDELYDAVLPLCEWKMKKGIETSLVRMSEIGNSRSQLQNYLEECYDTEGLTFVLLVGDDDGVPCQVGNVGRASGAPADPVFACLDGADWYPDCFVSRFSSQSVSDIQNMVARTIAYERYPSTGTDWYHLGTGIASDQGSPPDYTRMNWIRDDLLGSTYTAVDQIYDPGASAAQVAETINSGRSIVNYMGHGWNQGWGTAGFDNQDVEQLDNPWMLPLVTSVACYGGNFPGTTCFGEAWTRAGSAASPRGAIAFYGSSISQSWVPPTVGQAAAIDFLVQDDANTIGGILFNGACEMIEEYFPSYDGAEIFQTWHIFGDASVQLRTDTPRDLLVEHTRIARPGGRVSITVTSSGSPVEGALVCLWMVDELHIAGHTDVSGELSYRLPTDLPDGDMDVTVTAYNHIPYEGVCTVDRNAPLTHREAVIF